MGRSSLRPPLTLYHSPGWYRSSDGSSGGRSMLDSLPSRSESLSTADPESLVSVLLRREARIRASRSRWEPARRASGADIRAPASRRFVRSTPPSSGTWLSWSGGMVAEPARTKERALLYKLPPKARWQGANRASTGPKLVRCSCYAARCSKDSKQTKTTSYADALDAQSLYYVRSIRAPCRAVPTSMLCTGGRREPGPPF